MDERRSPGLAAKPIIDILVTVDDVANEDSYVSKLESMGFVVRVRELGHRMMRTPRPISEDEKESCSARVD
ncbi:GrpB family protein [Specibacter sp. NPDC078692]|uniref:GrpB family protein n=1 Tax=Specibacter sp. NPDC078692 TaxID=3155818 RepID=UPI00342417BE